MSLTQTEHTSYFNMKGEGHHRLLTGKLECSRAQIGSYFLVDFCQLGR